MQHKSRGDGAERHVVVGKAGTQAATYVGTSSQAGDVRPGEASLPNQSVESTGLDSHEIPSVTVEMLDTLHGDSDSEEIVALPHMASSSVESISDLDPDLDIHTTLAAGAQHRRAEGSEDKPSASSTLKSDAEHSISKGNV